MTDSEKEVELHLIPVTDHPLWTLEVDHLPFQWTGIHEWERIWEVHLNVMTQEAHRHAKKCEAPLPHERTWEDHHEVQLHNLKTIFWCVQTKPDCRQKRDKCKVCLWKAATKTFFYNICFLSWKTPICSLMFKKCIWKSVGSKNFAPWKLLFVWSVKFFLQNLTNRYRCFWKKIICWMKRHMFLEINICLTNRYTFLETGICSTNRHTS